jgi:Mg2+ and Co2+ transporter CorA
MVSETRLVTATWLPFDLPRSIPREAADGVLPDIKFPARMAYGVLALVRDRNAFVAQRHEEEILRVDEVRANEGGAQFLDRAYRLQREISTTTADVWRLKQIVRRLAEGKVVLQGADAKNDPFLDNLVTDIDGIHEKFGDLKESLKSLMEFHMDVTSFEMNKFMKLLAIVGFLGLIPSVAGGLLGMNVAGNPWSVTLGQVAFAIAMGMAIALYVFAIKGWLR